MAIYLESFMRSLERMGIQDVLLPFLLVFTLVFAVLEKTKILGTKPNINGKENRPKTNLNTMLSLVMGLGVVIPHATNSYPPGRDVVDILNTALPGVAMLLVAIFSFILLLGMFSGKQPSFLKNNTLSGIVVVVMLLAVITIFVDASNTYRLPRWLNFLHDPGVQAGVVVIAVFGLLVWFITRDDDSNPKDPENSMGAQFGRFLNGGE